MDSEEPPNVRVACSGDIDEVVRLMHDAARIIAAKRAEQEQTRRLLEQRERQLNPFQRTTPGSDPGRDGPARGL
ncbi:hypothetical protein ICM05_12485 [Leucobacter sp. cx-42]|uniref:hypothetical protein n=1 Tax=unclassified Leucobacter TaxID=2621730 RepID=UPI00165D8306|nr:hypothetical protein [Leucobacter sp. cx-42]